MSSNPNMADLLIELRQDIVAFREANRLLIQGVCVSLVRRGILTPTQAMARLAWLDERPTTGCGMRRDSSIQAPTKSTASLQSIKGGRLDS
jgi:hypothetical protein